MPAGSILVADDDTAIRTVLNQALSRAGYEVRLTGNVVMRVLYEQTPEKLSRELGELNPDKTTQPDEDLDGSMDLSPVKKFPIN